MNRKIVSGIVLTLLLMGMLPLAFNIESLKASSDFTFGFYKSTYKIYYDTLVSYLKTLGYTVFAVDELNFTYANVVYLDYRISYPLTEEELLDYVENGGSLWVGGEAVGGTFLGVNISSDSIWFVDSLSDPRVWTMEHPILKDVKSIAYPAGAWFEIAENIKRIMCIDGKAVLAVDSSRRGKMLWLIDSDVFGHYFLDDEDNGILARNIAAWLTTPTPQAVEATVDIDPKTLNLRSRGKWIAVYIELPENFEVEQIYISSIRLNGAIQAAPPFELGDHDNDAVPDSMVKFNRTEVTNYIAENYGVVGRFGEVTLTVTGQVGTLPYFLIFTFEGSDTIRVIGK